MKINEISVEEKKKILMNFYESFENGYEFEEFLKPFLEKLGLDEVKVTKRSNDGGVDLNGVRYGVIDTNGDSVKYKVQAKRYNPNNSPVSVDIVDRHRGIMKNGERGIIITTGKFSEPAIVSAASETERPILLIDGESLINICIENNIGFTYSPVFSRNELKNFYKAENNNDITSNNNLENLIVSDIRKDITSNDIRARIISIPRTILEELPNNKEIFDIIFNGNEIKNAKISSDRRYFSKGLSEMYRKYSLLGENGEFNPAKSIWGYDGEKIYIDLIK